MALHMGRFSGHGRPPGIACPSVAISTQALSALREALTWRIGSHQCKRDRSHTLLTVLGLVAGIRHLGALESPDRLSAVFRLRDTERLRPIRVDIR